MTSGAYCETNYGIIRDILFWCSSRYHYVLSKIRGSRKPVIFLVFLTNMLDNILLTAVVPIIPEILLDIDKTEFVESMQQYNRTLNHNVTNGAAWTVNSVTGDVNNVTNLGLAQRIMQVSFRAVNENSKVGWLLSSKALIQIFANPVVGSLSSRIGYSIVLFGGTNILLLSALSYTVSTSFIPLLLARCIQGIGSAASTISGMSLLADCYHDDKERSRVMGITMGGSALGVVVGYPFGGFLYSSLGKVVPFLILVCLLSLDSLLQIVILRPKIYRNDSAAGTSLYVLLRDPYIVIASGAVMFTTMSMAILEPTVPIWIIDTMHAKKWQLGLVFLPDSIGYLFGTNFFGVVARTVGRWICSLFCMLLIALCLVCIPFATEVIQLILPHFGLGLGLGITDAAIMPLLALLVDTRHVAAYGSVYSIVQLAVSLAYGVGPSIAGQVVRAVGFPWLMWGMAIANFLFCPFCFFLRNPPLMDENKPILTDKCSDTYTEADDTQDIQFTYERLLDED